MEVLAKVKNPALVSRFVELALVSSMLIDRTVHGGEILPRGTVMARIVSSKKYRAYAEGTIKAGGAFSASAPGFTLDVDVSPIAKHLRVGDVIESVSGTALGTIASYNPATGVGTLSGNSAAALAAGQKVRVAKSVLALAKGAGRILQDEVQVSSQNDSSGAAYFCGFFLKSNTTLTDDALSELGGYELEAGEARLV
jgi:hypothetical protein